jgi:hypothetical protein
LAIVAIRPDGKLLWIVVPAGSSVEAQMLWLFAIDGGDDGFKVKSDLSDIALSSFAANQILEELGVEVKDDDERLLDDLIAKFGEFFPTTKLFSEFARQRLDPSLIDGDPDEALSSYLEHEEKLFLTFERHIVGKRLETGFDDVKDFISYSLSVQNRRKSRAGYSLENHLEAIFLSRNVRFSRGRTTENSSKPDFIFPGIESYHEETFPEAKLTMLASKSTCKDRWRQILAEADRIKQKHLITIEPAISTSQTDQMKVQNVQLVVPSSLFSTFQTHQKEWLMSLSEFIQLVREKQDTM